MKKLPQKANDWTTLKTQEVYDNNWIKVEHNEVKNPNGGEGIYGAVRFKNIAIGIIPISNNGNITLVGQFRYPHNKYSWEIPEGGCPLNQEPLAAAKRELAEETGLSSLQWNKVIEMDLSNSATDEKAIIYLAENCTKGKPSPEETENLEIYECSVHEFIKRVEDGEIRDSLSVTAGLWLKANYEL